MSLFAVLGIFASMLWAQSKPTCGLTFACPHAPILEGMTADQTRKELITVVWKAVDAHNEYQKAVAEELALRRELKRSSDYTQQGKWEKRVKEIEGKKTDMQEAFSRVTEEFQEAYGIAPVMNAGPVKGGNYPDFSPAWAPKIIPKDGDGNSKYAHKFDIYPAGVGYVAIDFSQGYSTQGSAATLENGESIIRIETLEDSLGPKHGAATLDEAIKLGSPAWLASTYFHESVHFTDLITTGWTTIAAEEKHAFETVSVFSDAFQLNRVQKAKVDKLAKTNADAARNGTSPSAYMSRRQLLTAKQWSVNQESAEEAIRKGQEELRAQLEAERARRENPDTHDAPNDPGAQTPQQPPMPLMMLQEVIASFAGEFCANPDAVWSQEKQNDFRSIPNYPPDQAQRIGTPNLHMGYCRDFVFFTLWNAKMKAADGYDPQEVLAAIRRGKEIEDNISHIAPVPATPPRTSPPSQPPVPVPPPQAPIEDPDDRRRAAPSRPPPSRNGGCYWSNDGREICP